MSVDRAKLQNDADRLVRMGRYDEAIASYEQLLLITPRDMNVKSRLAELHFRAGSIAGAVQIWGEVAEFYEREGFHMKAVALRKRIKAMGSAGQQGSRRPAAAPGAPPQQASVLPFLGPSSPGDAARRPRPLGRPASPPAPLGPAHVEPLHPDDDALVVRVNGAIDRLRKIQGERKRLQERLAVIEDKKSATVATVYDRVRKDALLKLGAIDQVMEACFREVHAVREANEGERHKVEERLAALTTDLEELRFLQSIGDYSREEFVVAERTKLEEMELARGRSATLAGLTGQLDAMVHAVAPRVEVEEGDLVEALDALDVFAAPELSPAERPSGEAEIPPTAAAAEAVETDEALFASASAEAETVAPAAAPAAGQPTLVLHWPAPSAREETFVLGPGTTCIGRAPDSGICVLDRSISRRHAMVRVDGDGITVEDLGSANGCAVNGAALAPHEPRRLRDGDVVRLGGLEAVFRGGPPPPAAPADGEYGGATEIIRR